MKFACLAQGKLYFGDGTSQPRLIESAFAQDVVNRALAREHKNSWKTSGTSAAAMMARQNMMEGSAALVNVKITAVGPSANADELLYVVASDAVGGLFSYNLSTQKELRIFHKENLSLSDFARNPSKDLFACSQRHPGGTASIAICQGNDISQVTEGDSVDEAPSWINDKVLVYQSAGIARNQSGIMLGLGPSSIQKLDLGNGTVVPMMENEAYDYLIPRATTGGDLYFIRRPYEPPFKRNYPAHKAFMDLLLFPFRLMRAFFDFLNVFSMVFSKKPLTTSGGPKLEGPNEKNLFLRGRIIDAEQALKKGTPLGEEPVLVPKTWQLVRRQQDGKENIIASGVLAYDVDAEGNVLYSTGLGVYRCASDGSRRELVFKEKFVDTVSILQPA